MTDGHGAPRNAVAHPARLPFVRVERQRISVRDSLRLKRSTRQALAAAASVLPQLRLVPGEVARFRRALLERPRPVAALQHRLSPYLPGVDEVEMPDPGIAGREWQALQAWRCAGDPRLDPAGLGKLGASLVDGKAVIRACGVGLAPSHGASIEFCPPAEVRPALEQACMHARDTREPPLVRAVELHAMLLNIHPFGDGNGRVSRIVLNHCLHAAGMPATTYLPLKEIFWHARGGHELALREAEIHEQWDPLMKFFARLVLLVARNPCTSATRAA